MNRYHRLKDNQCKNVTSIRTIFHCKRMKFADCYNSSTHVWGTCREAEVALQLKAHLCGADAEQRLLLAEWQTLRHVSHIHQSGPDAGPHDSNQDLLHYCERVAAFSLLSDILNGHRAAPGAKRHRFWKSPAITSPQPWRTPRHRFWPKSYLAQCEIQT